MLARQVLVRKLSNIMLQNDGAGLTNGGLCRQSSMAEEMPEGVINADARLYMAVVSRAPPVTLCGGGRRCRSIKLPVAGGKCEDTRAVCPRALGHVVTTLKAWIAASGTATNALPIIFTCVSVTCDLAPVCPLLIPLCAWLRCPA